MSVGLLPIIKPWTKTLVPYPVVWEGETSDIIDHSEQTPVSWGVTDKRVNLLKKEKSNPAFIRQRSTGISTLL